MTDDRGAGVRFPYPPSDRDDIVETWHGEVVADPYRWLEDPASERTRSWVAAQDALARSYLADLGSRQWFTDCLDRILRSPRAGVPDRRGGRYLVGRNNGTDEQDRWHVADSLAELVAGGRVLIDPAEFAPDGRVSVTGVTLSPDGKRVAYALSDAGSDWRTWRVRDATTGVDLPDRVTRSKIFSPQWLPGSSAFLYWGYPDQAHGSGADPGALPTTGSLLLHRLGTEQADDEVVYHDPAAPRILARGQVTDDGRWLVLTFQEGTDRRNRVAVRPIDPGDTLGPQRDLVTEVYAQFEFAGSHGDLLYFLTNHQADRYRLVAASVAPQTGWSEVVSERDQVLQQVVRAGDELLAVYVDDAAHRVHRLAADGTPLGELTFDGPVAVTAVHGRAGEDEAFLGVTTFVQDTRCYRLDLATGVQELVPLVAEPARAAAPVVTERAHGTSADGTTVPYFRLRRADRPATAPGATLLFGYGGHSIPMTPVFHPAWAAWVQAGGVLAVANLRGGGEYGRAWFEAGRRHHKQRVFDDFIAVAEDLVASGTTTREQLALHGRSGGGLLVTAVLTQRPDLAAVVLPMVAVTDMLRFTRFTIGWAWTPDLGDPDVAEDFAVLRAYSPLHNLREGGAYPATLLLAGDHDDRAVPAHSYKFTAALQHAQAGDAPVLLRVDRATGHAGPSATSKPRSALVAELADLLAFAATHTGLTTAPDEAQ